MPEPTDDDVAAWFREGAHDTGEPANVAQMQRPQGNGAKKPEAKPSGHRLLPQAPECEEGVLSAFMNAPLDVGCICAEKGLTNEHFHIPANSTMFRVLMWMWDQNKPTDFITFTRELHDQRVLDGVGGAAKVTEIYNQRCPSAMVAQYIDTMLEKAEQRDGIKVLGEYRERLYDEGGLQDELESAVMKVRKGPASGQIIPVKTHVAEAIDHIQMICDRKGQCSGISTGLPDLDRKINGLEDSLMYVFAARASGGKTAFLLTLAANVALDLKLPVLIFSLEMSAMKLIKRMIISRARVDINRVRDGVLTKEESIRMHEAANLIGDSPIHIDEARGQSIQEMRAKARRYHKQFGIRAIFIDYLQKAKSGSKRAHENRQLEVSEISGGCADMAAQLKVPVVVLAQLGRGVEQRSGGLERPRLSDLKESGAIEQDADVVGFIIRDELVENAEKKRDATAEINRRAEVMIEKQRDGETGPVALTFFREFTLFESFCPEPEERPMEQMDFTESKTRKR